MGPDGGFIGMGIAVGFVIAIAASIICLIIGLIAGISAPKEEKNGARRVRNPFSYWYWIFIILGLPAAVLLIFYLLVQIGLI